MPGWEKFVSPERWRLQPPEAVLDRLPWEGVRRVLDVGCGPGFWTLAVAGRLGEGFVTAADPSAEMVRVCRERAAGLPVAPCRCAGDDLPFAAGAFQRAFLVNLLHEVAEPGRVIAETWRCVALGGDLLVIDFEARPTAFGPPVAERIPRERMAALLEEGVGAPEPVAAYADFYAFRVCRG